MAGPLGVTHMIIINKTDAGSNMRVARLPRGPTLTFRIKRYSHAADVARLQRSAEESEARAAAAEAAAAAHTAEARREAAEERSRAEACRTTMTEAVGSLQAELSSARQAVQRLERRAARGAAEAEATQEALLARLAEAESRHDSERALARGAAEASAQQAARRAEEAAADAAREARCALEAEAARLRREAAAAELTHRSLERELSRVKVGAALAPVARPPLPTPPGARRHAGAGGRGCPRPVGVPRGQAPLARRAARDGAARAQRAARGAADGAARQRRQRCRSRGTSRTGDAPAEAGGWEGGAHHRGRRLWRAKPPRAPVRRQTGRAARPHQQLDGDGGGVT